YVRGELGEHADHVAAREQLRHRRKIRNRDQGVTPELMARQKVVENGAPSARRAHDEMRIRKDGADIEFRPRFQDRMPAAKNAVEILIEKKRCVEMPRHVIEPAEGKVDPV